MWEIVGFENAKGVTKSTGEAWTGYRIYVEKVSQRPQVDGIEVRAEFYKTSRIAYVPVLGDRVYLEYNQYGLFDIQRV